jgi:aspartate/tyrosine/aromatic aminotransferase
MLRKIYPTFNNFSHKFHRIRSTHFSSLFQNLKVAEVDQISILGEEFNKDNNPNKVNLSRGVYKTEDGNPFKLPCVKKAEELYMHQHNHEYSPIEGDIGFIRKAEELAFGMESKILTNGKLVSMQTLSGSGALRIGCDLLNQICNKEKNVYIPNPSWLMHKTIVEKSGMNCFNYQYYDFIKRKFDFEGMISDIKLLPNNSILILHGAGHNPTGTDPTQQEWNAIFNAIKSKNHFPFFDMAYQGFASGDATTDAYAVRLFADNEYPLALSQSFSKNFGLYSERIGLLSVLCNRKEEAESILPILQNFARASYSSPPKYGAQLIKTILSDPTLKDQWYTDLKHMSGRLMQIRKRLYDELQNARTDKNWDYILKQIGMFAFTDLSPKQCSILKTKYHIYLTDDGRISLSGLNNKNVEYVAQAIHQVTKH